MTINYRAELERLVVAAEASSGALGGPRLAEWLAAVRLAEWLAAVRRARASIAPAAPGPNPPVEPRGCPIPGACACPAGAIVPPELIVALWKHLHLTRSEP